MKQRGMLRHQRRKLGGATLVLATLALASCSIAVNAIAEEFTVLVVHLRDSPSGVHSLPEIQRLSLSDTDLIVLEVSGQDHNYPLAEVLKVELLHPGSGVQIRPNDYHTHGLDLSIGPNPNAGNSETTLDYRIVTPTHVRVGIYSLSGRFVATIVDERLTAGEHRATWNGFDNSGQAVSAGIYFCRVSTSSAEATRGFLLLK